MSNRNALVPGDGSELGSLLQAALEKEDPGHAEQVGYPPESSRENYLATEGRWLGTTSPLVLLVTTKCLYSSQLKLSTGNSSESFRFRQQGVNNPLLTCIINLVMVVTLAIIIIEAFRLLCLPDEACVCPCWSVTAWSYFVGGMLKAGFSLTVMLLGFIVAILFATSTWHSPLWVLCRKFNTQKMQMTLIHCPSGFGILVAGHHQSSIWRRDRWLVTRPKGSH